MESYRNIHKALKQKVLIFAIIFFSLFLASCDIASNPKTDDYYVGSQGVEVNFLANSPPANLYFYGDGDVEENSFTIDVDLHNEGASLTKGAVFVSGYDPGMIHVDGVEPLQSGVKDCTFDISSIGTGGLYGFVDCHGSHFETTPNSWEVELNDIGETLNKYGIGWNTSKYLSDLDVSFGDDAQGSEGGGYFNFGFDNPVSVDYDSYNHGKRLLIYLPSFNIDFHFGQEYILPADDYNYPGGGIDYKTFNAQIVDWPLGLDETTVPFMITNCYVYTTYASPTVCIDPEPYTETRKVCTPGETSLRGTQGAPVAITNIRQENTKTKAIFEITVSNVGNGQVYDLGYFARCNPYNTERVTEQHLDVVYLADVRIGKDHLDCNIDNRRIKMRDGTGKIVCTYDYRYVPSKNAYQTPLTMELWYGYSDSTERNVRIKKVS